MRYEQMRREVRECAVRLLSRREHSLHELTLKLRQRGYASPIVEAVAAEFARKRWVSDERYAAALAHGRRRQGYGPLRIRAELRHHGVVETLADPQLPWDDADWIQRAQHLCTKRFGDCASASPREWERRFRFLLNRGFTREQIRRVLEDRSADECSHIVD